MVALGALLLLAAPPPPPPSSTHVAIDGTRWIINGALTSPGTPAEGLLLNLRVANGVFDDDNATTAARWAYPDTGVWDAERNTRELAGNLSGYRAAGVHAITVGLQGGSPTCYGNLGRWIVSAFNEDGTLKPAWLARLDTLLRAANAAGVVVIVQYFYLEQFVRIKEPRAAVAAITAWLLQTGLNNVLVEVFNELCTADVAAYINQVHDMAAASGRVLLTSTSCTPGRMPDAKVIAASDYILQHSNAVGLVKYSITAPYWIRRQRAFLDAPKPIVFNEDDPRVKGDEGYFGDDTNLGFAVAANESWGFMCCCGATEDEGYYEGSVGYQCPPVNYGLRGQCHSDPDHEGPHMAKEEFFAATARLTAA